MILKTITAGPLVQEVLYDNIRIEQDETLEEKREKTAIRKGVRSICSNRQYAVAALIMQNFSDESLWCTLTFDLDRTPRDRSETARRFGYFREKLKASGYKIRYIKCIEHRHKNEKIYESNLYHVHAIIDGAPAEEILRCWIYNSPTYCKVEPLDLRRVVPYAKKNGKLSRGLASYIIKERPDKIGQRQVQCSQRSSKLEYPKITKRRVAKDFPFPMVPPDAHMLEKVQTVCNQYGAVWYCRYLLPY